MKTILGLDLGPNSIGWAKVEVDDEGNYLRNIKLGSRIIPMTQDMLGDFDKGVRCLKRQQERIFEAIDV